MISKRCDFNMTNCESYDIMNIRDICKIFELEDQLWSEFMNHVNPKITCPFKKGAHKITEALVDVGYIAHLPIHGFLWVTEKVYKVTKRRKKKRLVFCVTFELRVQKKRTGRERKLD